MSGLVASRFTGSWWRVALVMWVLMAGQAAVSAVEITTTFVSTNVPQRIPRQAGGGANADAESTVVVRGIQTPITQVAVTIYATHRWPADLRITLVPPEGPTAAAGVLILDDGVVYSTQTGSNQLGAPFSNRSSFNTGLGISNTPEGRIGFVDGGAVINPANTDHVNNGLGQVHLLPLVDGYAPAQPLAAFNGMMPTQSNGTWTLVLEDVFNTEDDGNLIYWSLTITEPGPHTWTGAAAPDDNWSTAANWLDNNPPNVAETAALLIFPAGAEATAVDFDVPLAPNGDFRVGTMIIDDAYTFTTSNTGRLTLIANSTVTVNSPTDVDFAIPLELIGQPTITVSGAGSFNLTGDIDNDGAAAGLIFAGTGPKSLSGDNGYTGVTTVNAGILDVASNNALGTNAGGTTVALGATVRIGNNLTVPEVITIQGTGADTTGVLVFTGGTSSIGGMTLVAASPATISVLGGAATIGTVTAAAATAIHTLSVTNAGTLAINGALPTTTALSLNGGATTFGAAQPNITTLNLSNGADLNVGASATVSGTITVTGTATNSTISGTALNLGGGNRTINVSAGAAGSGGEANTTSSDLAITAGMTTGSFTKQGSGVLRITGNNTGVGATVSGGTLAGAGNIGSINVLNGALSPSGQFIVGGAVNLANRTGFILPVGATANPAINATGTVSLNGTAGSGGAVLQAYAGAGNTIITAGAVTGTFDGKANGAGITYNAASVVLAASGRTMAFTPAGPFNVDESDGTLEVTVTASAGGTAPFLRVFGGLVEGRDVSLVGLAPAGTYVFTIPISDNFIDTGDVTGTLAIVPQDGSLVTNSARLTINDNDGDDSKTCGFGTGLTVFLLLGFALAFRMRLRRP